MAHFNQVGFSQLSIADPVSNARTKTAQLTESGVVLRASLGTPQQPLYCPYHPSAFQDPKATRVNLTVQITPELKAWVEGLETAVLTKLQAEPERFGKYTAESIKSLFRSALREHQGFWYMKLKVTLGDSVHALRIWDAKGGRTEMPVDMSRSWIVPMASARHVWLTSAGIGVLFEATDVLLVSTNQVSKSPWSETPF